MSEETKKTAEAPEQEAKETEAAPQEAPETAAAPEKEAEAEPADAKKKDGWFNKKAREMDAVKAKLDAAEKNAAQAKDQLLRMAAEYENYRKRSTREADQKFNDGVSHAVTQILGILDTLDMAASPVLATMMVSAMPMVTARNCSTIRGKISLRRSFAVNMPPPSFSNLNDRGRPPRMQALKRQKMRKYAKKSARRMGGG